MFTKVKCIWDPDIPIDAVQLVGLQCDCIVVCRDILTYFFSIDAFFPLLLDIIHI